MSRGERVQAGRTVCLDYTLRLSNGTLIDSAQQSGTWTYVHGHTRMPPGLRRGVEGLGVGDTVRLELDPADAFGCVDPAAFRELPREQFPASDRHLGFAGEMPAPDGSIIPYRIHAINDTTVTIDLNHPLAGEPVVFEVTVIHVQD